MSERFRTRSHELERIDTGDYTPAEYARWQREMPWIHRVFGENRALRNSLLAEIRRAAGSAVSILDVGAGSGTLLKTVQADLYGHSPFLVGVELNHEAAIMIATNGLVATRCDGTSLPFGDDSFDHAYSTLTFHHFTDDEAAAVLREMARVSRGRIFVIDLNRSAMAYYTYRALAPIMLQRLTVEDGALSILRSFNEDELLQLAREADLADVGVEHSPLNRLILSGRKR